MVCMYLHLHSTYRNHFNNVNARNKRKNKIFRNISNMYAKTSCNDIYFLDLEFVLKCFTMCVRVNEVNIVK